MSLVLLIGAGPTWAYPVLLGHRNPSNRWRHCRSGMVMGSLVWGIGVLATIVLASVLFQYTIKNKRRAK